LSEKPETGRFAARVALAAAIVFAARLGLEAAPPSRVAGELDAAGLKALIGSPAQTGRVVFVNFWATWCVPCREEFPDLVRPEKELGPKGLSIIGVSTDFASQTAGVEQFLEVTKPNFPNYRKRAGGDDQAFIEAVDSGWGGELPFSVIYGRDGEKWKVFSGKRSHDEYAREIRKALAARGAKTPPNP
jgi:thiol-disulfide isomerase/thioredoxin